MIFHMVTYGIAVVIGGIVGVLAMALLMVGRNDDE